MAISADGTRLYVANTGDGTVSVINTTGTPAVVGTIAVGPGIRDLAISPDGVRLYVATDGIDGNPGSVSVINTTGTPAVVATVAVDHHPTALALSPNGTRVYVADSGGTVSVINTTGTPAVTTTIQGFGNAVDVAVSPDLALAFVISRSGINSGYISVIDTSGTPRKVDGVRLSEIFFNPISMAISPDGGRLYITGDYTFPGKNPDSVVAGWEIRKNHLDWPLYTVLRGQIDLAHIAPHSMAVGPSRIFVTGSDGRVVIRDDGLMDHYNTIDGGGPGRGVAISPDGTRLYVASGNPGAQGVVTVFDTTRIRPSANPPAEIQAELTTARFNTSVFGGWIPIVGTLYNANNLKLDIQEYKAAVASGNGDDMRDEQIDMFIDAVGMIPVVGAPAAGIIWAAMNPG